jgi:enoyl-CoA hydratase/carnithine racemase
VLTGTGTAFCAGFDLKEFAQPDLASTIRDSSRRYHLAVWGFAKPMIAAVNGAAFGGGDLSLLCDIRIAVPTAEFAHPEIKFGAPPLFTPLQCIVDAGIARDLCATGRRIDAAEAHLVGVGQYGHRRPPRRSESDSTGDSRSAAARPRSQM